MKLLGNYSTLSVIITLIVLMLYAADVKAGTQVVSITPAVVFALPNRPLILSVKYDVSEGAKKTTGLGLRIYFDSRALASVKLEELFGEGLIAFDEKAMDDTSDCDNDPTTDKYLGIAWIGVAGDWPSFLNLPITLAKVLLQVREASGIRNTSINIVTSSTSVGYILQGRGAVITLP